VIGICCDNNSKFEKMCEMTIKLPFNNEIDGEINKIPTNSSMVQLLFGNILVSKLKENINIHQYKRNHPSGLIGGSLKTIKECLITEYPKLILDNNESVKLHNIFLEMTKYKIGCCFFINNDNNLLGILTDGDIRRLLLNNSNKTDITINDINCDYYFESDINKYVTDCKIKLFPVIIKNNLLGIIFVE
jgi:arabinose-5-phosphate isomerase